ncbi:unnamed protein product [Ceratitis capitata]|uniref:(Mediterranean fruit fly) hypothetical protein n=1 Tax=Ceratitis capitata TaxID=7213 RepID=A0A811V3F4_CERCA|nr:unnamed protein product [Ceratitis capitata]
MLEHESVLDWEKGEKIEEEQQRLTGVTIPASHATHYEVRSKTLICLDRSGLHKQNGRRECPIEPPLSGYPPCVKS